VSNQRFRVSRPVVQAAKRAFTCALLLVHFKHHGGSLGLAAFLSARNDVLANAAIILAGLATSATQSIWPTSSSVSASPR
jgi:Co/Zn/Cd efflux system component